jgi:YD repeat-containing protein
MWAACGPVRREPSVRPRRKSVYNAVGSRLETITYPRSPAAAVTYTYDLAGNRLSTEDEHGTTTHEYDARNRLAKETKAQGWVLEYDYDLAGNKVEFSLTVNSTVNVTTYTYEKLSRLAEEEQVAGGGTPGLVEQVRRALWERGRRLPVTPVEKITL